MSETRRVNAEIRQQEGHIVGFALRWGAYISVAVVAAGQVLAFFHPAFEVVAKAGVLLLIFTPVVRIVVACAVFASERDRRYTLVSLGVLFIVVMTSVAALLGWMSPPER